MHAPCTGRVSGFTDKTETLCASVCHRYGSLCGITDTSSDAAFIEVAAVWLVCGPFHQSLLWLLDFLGLTAGLFEETARWVCLRFFLKKRNRYVDGLSFGLGHGGIEAVLIVGISYLNNLIVSVVWAAGGDLTKTFGIPEAEAGTIAVTFASLGFGDIIIGGVERVLALMMHLGFTMLIFYGVRKGQSVRYWIAAILAHGFADASIGFWQAAGVQGMALEGILAVYALLLFGWVIWCRKHLPEGLPTDSTVEKEMEEREGTEHD